MEFDEDEPNNIPPDWMLSLAGEVLSAQNSSFSHTTYDGHDQQAKRNPKHDGDNMDDFIEFAKMSLEDDFVYESSTPTTVSYDVLLSCYIMLYHVISCSIMLYHAIIFKVNASYRTKHFYLFDNDDMKFCYHCLIVISFSLGDSQNGQDRSIHIG